jgi:hypothetical protein
MEHISAVLSIDIGYQNPAICFGNHAKLELLEFRLLNYRLPKCDLRQWCRNFFADIKPYPTPHTVLIEKQHPRNKAACALERILEKFFTQKGCIVLLIPPYDVMLWFGLGRGRKNKKKSAVTLVKEMFDANAIKLADTASASESMNMFMQTKKQDDISDAILQYVYYMFCHAA